MGKTSIEWTDESTNPIRARLAGSGKTRGGYDSGVGHYCEKVSPGCKNCYSSTTQPRFGLPLFQDQKIGTTGGIETFLDASKLEEVLRRKKPTKFFWCDMTDMFGRWIPNEWIAACFGVMAATPQHTHQVLTKRADRLPEWFEWASARASANDSTAGALCQAHASQHLGKPSHEFAPSAHPAWPLPNVWLGVSVENDAHRHRVDDLLRTPAALRFISYEPGLGPLDGSRFIRPRSVVDGYRAVQERFPSDGPVPTHLAAPGVDWVIVGGESGHGARPFDVVWADSIVRQCRAAGVSVFVKQLGATPYDSREAGRDGEPHPDGAGADPDCRLELRDRKGGDMEEWAHELRVREFPR